MQYIKNIHYKSIYSIFAGFIVLALFLFSHTVLASTNPHKDFRNEGVKQELEIYQVANRIASMGWVPGKQYKMNNAGKVCVSGGCYNLYPVGIAKNRARGRGVYADYYGSSIMTKMLTEYILGYKVPFTSGDRPRTLGSNRHHTNGASYAFDLRSSGRTSEKVRIAAAWKFAAQSFGFPASVGMKYAKTPSMVHVDTKHIGSGQAYSWGWGGSTNTVGNMVLRYYGKSRQTRMPYQVLVAAFNGQTVDGVLDTGVYAGVQTSLPALAKIRSDYSYGVEQPYQTDEAYAYNAAYGSDGYVTSSSQGDGYYTALPQPWRHMTTDYSAYEYYISPYSQVSTSTLPADYDGGREDNYNTYYNYERAFYIPTKALNESNSTVITIKVQ